MSCFAKKITSTLLACVLLLGVFPAFPVQADTAAASNAISSNTLPAAYTAAEIKLNGLLNDEGWSLPIRVGEDCLLGAQWNMTTLYLGIRTPDKQDVTITLNGKNITAANATIKRPNNKNNVECSVALDKIGVTVKDYGVQIPAKIEIGNNVWEGTIVLTSTDWVVANNPNVTADAGLSRVGLRLVHPESKPTANQNAAKVSGGYNFYDRYDPNGLNPPAVYSQTIYSGEKYAALSEPGDNVFGFTFHADSMPVYRLGADNDFYPHLVAGFNWYISSDATSTTGASYVTMAIVNTDIGLVFVLRDADRDRTYILNKHVGDTFYIETVWTKDGDVILSIDQQKVAVFEDAQISMTGDIRNNAIVMTLLRSVEPAKSEADTFDITATGMSFGKYHGESLIDSLSFSSIMNNASNQQYYVKKDLSLPKTYSTDVFSAPVQLEWASSAPDVIDPASGKVTQPATSGALVTLTATAPSLGTSKEIEVYVAPAAPQDDILVCKDDMAAYSGKGKIFEGYLFTLDEANNSIIRDLKEAKTVNVIALKDSDDVCRLNESNLTVWTSDDNKEYTQIESFKLLRDGQYTYLYGFEATARYFKVHCTLHSTTDSDFIGPIDGMIDAYYETVFGDGGASFATESAVTIKNETDVDMKDVLSTVSPETAGVVSLGSNYADVRFFIENELLYHYYDGKNFLVRIPDLAAGSSVTVRVLSGNASAKDIANMEAAYEVMYGTKETYSGFKGHYYIELNNGMLMGFHGQGGYVNGQLYFYLSKDGGTTHTSLMGTSGTLGYICNAHGSGYDDVTGRIFVHGYRQENGKNVGSIVYSDDNGKKWTLSEINYEMEGDEPFSFTYSNIVKVSSYDGENGPNVDFVIATGRDSEAMREHYGNGYYHGEMTALYTTDNGKTWTKSADGVRFFGGDDQDHIREHGLCEQVVMENSGGVLFLYSRCQYEETLHFGYGVSYDFGKTWSEEAVLSNIYTTNTQPELFKMDGYDFIAWGGNNVYGGGSYRRYPLNVAVSYDGMYTFEDIQDLFLRTEFQGMVNGTCINAMNPNVTVTGDRMFVSSLSNTISDSNNFRYVYVDNFIDYFFRTKGAYDSFEGSTTEYEGWSTTGGQVEASDVKATDGAKSMLFAPGSAAVRSLPSVSDGTIAFDLFVEDVAKANLEFELETSHGPYYGTAAPIAFKLSGDQLEFLGGGVIDSAIKNGWNNFAFTLSLSGETPTATLSINGGEAITVPVNAEIGNYICYAHVVCQGELAYYLDAFLVEDMDDSATLTVTAADASSEGKDPTVADTTNDFTILWLSIGTAVLAVALLVFAVCFKPKKKSE